MKATMSARLAAALATTRSVLDVVERLDPRERDFFYSTLVSDLRSRNPECVSPLTIGPPTEPIRDPRGSGGGR